MAMAPEFVIIQAAVRFIRGRDMMKSLQKSGKQEWTLTHTQFAFADGFYIIKSDSSDGQPTDCGPYYVHDLIKKGGHDQPTISEDELLSRGKIDWVVKLIAMLQIIWFVIQTLLRAIQRYQVTPLEVMTVAFVFCSVFVYGLSMKQPQGVDYPIIIDARKTESAKIETGQEPSSDTMLHTGEVPKLSPLIHDIKRSKSAPPAFASGKHQFTASKTLSKFDLPPVNQPLERRGSTKSKRSGDTKGPNLLPNRVDSGSLDMSKSWIDTDTPLILLAVIACSFGAIHCLAWNSAFPTLGEKLVWRICSATITALPPFLCLHMRQKANKFWTFTAISSIVSYVIGRLTIIVLAFETLRALPADAFQTIDWNQYIPHFAA